MPQKDQLAKAPLAVIHFLPFFRHHSFLSLFPQALYFGRPVVNRKKVEIC